MLSRQEIRGAAAVVAAGLACGSALAEAGTFASSPSGGRVRAGDVVPVAWRIEASEANERDEMELVLSLDDGATFPIRVVARLTPANSKVRWRVPALPSEHARLALRAGEDGASETEEIVAVSDAFAITASRFETLERLYAVADEWRTREALEGAPARSTADGLESEEETPEVVSRDRQTNEPETCPMAGVAPAAFDAGRAMDAPRPGRPWKAPRQTLRAPRPLRL